MALPHGFKANANRIALGLRRQMGVAETDPIDLSRLAERLGLSVVPISNFASVCPESLEQLVRKDAGAFSALLLPVGNGRRIILHNDTNSRGRRNSDLAHEISHALLAHPPRSLFNGSGCRHFDPDMESQANCLAGHILISNEAARHIVYSRLDLGAACAAYGVSRDMMEFRLNASGARKQHQRWKRQRRAGQQRAGM
jgi:Zn-dependent peptidase ImmA (M78 family)